MGRQGKEEEAQVCGESKPQGLVTSTGEEKQSARAAWKRGVFPGLRC